MIPESIDSWSGWSGALPIGLFESLLYDTFGPCLPIVRDLRLTWVEVLEQTSARGFGE